MTLYREPEYWRRIVGWGGMAALLVLAHTEALAQTTQRFAPSVYTKAPSALQALLNQGPHILLVVPNPSHTTLLVGRGFNSKDLLPAADCFEATSITTRKLIEPGGQTSELTLHVVKSTESLRKELNMSGAASFELGVYSGSFSANYRSFETQSTHVGRALIRAVVTLETEVVQTAPLKFLAPIQTLITDKNSGEFFDKCGDLFVGGIVSGAELTGYLDSLAVNSADLHEFAASIKVANALYGDVSVSAKTVSEKLRSIEGIDLKVVRRGPVAALPGSIDTFVEQARKLPEDLKAKPTEAWPMVVFLSSYKQLSQIPSSIVYDLVSANEFIASVGQQYDDARVVRDTIVFIRSHRDRFRNIQADDYEPEFQTATALMRKLNDAYKGCVARRQGDCGRAPQYAIPVIKVDARFLPVDDRNIDASWINPGYYCVSHGVPSGRRVEVWMSGSWDYPDATGVSPFHGVHPAMIFTRGIDDKVPLALARPYGHPTVLSEGEDYEVCVRPHVPGGRPHSRDPMAVTVQEALGR